MTAKENTRAGTAIPTRAVETEDTSQMAHASTRDDTTIGGCGQMVDTAGEEGEVNA